MRWPILMGIVGSLLLTTAAWGEAPELEKVKSLCRGYTEGFVHPATDLAYGKRINGPRGIDVLESPAEIAQQRACGRYLPWGYGAGIEDLAYQNGMLLFALCDVEQATGDAFFADMARSAFRGLRGMSTLSKVEGFVPRGPHPDGKSYYRDSSLDQHSLYVCGLWRYYRSRLASDADRQWIREMIIKVVRRMEKNHWSILSEDDSVAAHAGGNMLTMEPTTAALLFMMLAAAHDVTGDPHWKEAYDQFSREDNERRWKLLARKIDRQRKPDSPRWNMFYNQDALRTETLRRIETDDARKAVLRERLVNMTEDMLASSYFRIWRSLLGGDSWQAAATKEAANAYLEPLGLTVDSEVTVMDLWRKFDANKTPQNRRIRYESLTLGTPAMVWQVALLSGDPKLQSQVMPVVDEMLGRVDFSTIGSGWSYNYALLAVLWRLAPPQ